MQQPYFEFVIHSCSRDRNGGMRANFSVHKERRNFFLWCEVAFSLASVPQTTLGAAGGLVSYVCGLYKHVICGVGGRKYSVCREWGIS